jgi:hypothetical protein
MSRKSSHPRLLKCREYGLAQSGRSQYALHCFVSEQINRAAGPNLRIALRANPIGLSLIDYCHRVTVQRNSNGRGFAVVQGIDCTANDQRFKEALLPLVHTDSFKEAPPQ